MRLMLLPALVAILTGAGAGGQAPKDKADRLPVAGDPQAAIEPRSGPGAGQKFLRQFVGEWVVAKAFYPRDGGEPARSLGVCSQKLIHDGRFLQSEFVFGAGAGETTGLGLIGFDPDNGRFTSVWTDSRQTRMSFRQGQDKFDGRQIVLYSEALGGDAAGRRSKTVTEMADQGNRIVHRQFGIGADGQERLVMELVMARKVTAPAK
jgi:hypothetical protein